MHPSPQHRNPLSPFAERIAISITDGHYRQAIRSLENDEGVLTKDDASGLLTVVAFDFNNILTALFGFCDLSAIQLDNYYRPLDREGVLYNIKNASGCAQRLHLLRQINEILHRRSVVVK